MADSGSFNTSSYSSDDGTLYLKFEWSIKSQDPATNKTVINWSLKGAGLPRGYYYRAGGFKVVINGKTVYSKSTDYRIDLYADTVVASGTAEIIHDTDGTKEFSASAEAGIYYYAVNCRGSDSWDLTPIPRYATVTQSESEKTETSIKMNWASDSTVDYIWYSADNGSNWTGVNVSDGKNGTYTISGLLPNTTYKIKTRVRRKDSQLTNDSTALEVTTYNYPYCTEAPAFTIGEPVTLKFYNPLGREFAFYIICNGVEIDNNWTISGESYYGLGAQSTQNQLYATLPNSQNAKYSVVTIYDGYRISYTSRESVISVDPTKCAPVFNDFEYTDAFQRHITGNQQIMIKDYSFLDVHISPENQMTAVYGASPVNYVVTVDTLSRTADYEAGGQSIGVGSIKSAGVKRLTVRAYDSRGLSTPVYKDITVIDYAKPVINAEVKRLNNFETETTLKISGTFSPLTIDGTDKNTFYGVEYRYRETNGTWSEYISLNTTIKEGEFTCGDAILALDNTKAFEFEIYAQDNLDIAKTSAHVGVGQAIFFISTNKRKCYINGVEVPTVDQLYPTGAVSTEESMYPVGSVYCSSTNVNPSESLGGTWELVDKGFKAGTTETTQEATEYLSAFKIASVRNGNTIRLRLNVTTAKDIGETTVSLGTVDLAKHGLIKDSTGFFPYTVYSGVAMSDGANAVILIYFTSNGVLQTADCFTSDGIHTLPAGTPFYYDVVLPVMPSQMLDAFCDKFYWKRTA